MTETLKAEISNEIHAKCKEVRDYAGCVQIHEKANSSKTNKVNFVDLPRCNKSMPVNTWDKCVAKVGKDFEGEFTNGKPTGMAIIKADNGHKYIGQIINGRVTGNGVYTYESGNTYEGDLIDAKRNGYGIFKWTNGDEYKGEWVDNKSEGYGIYKWAKGDEYKGEWVDSKREGYGIYTFKNGKTQIGKFKGDNFIGSGEVGMSKAIENRNCSEGKKDYFYTYKIKGGLFKKSKKQTVAFECLTSSEVAQINAGINDIEGLKSKIRNKNISNALNAVGNSIRMSTMQRTINGLQYRQITGY